MDVVDTISVKDSIYKKELPLYPLEMTNIIVKDKLLGDNNLQKWVRKTILESLNMEGN